MNEEQPTSDPEAQALPPGAPDEKPVLEYRGAKVQTLQYSSVAAAPDDWIDIFRARDYLEANLLVGKLQDSGIHARVDMENVAAMGSWAGGGPGGSNVQVLSSEAVEARRLIDELEKIRAARRSATWVHCPQCNHAPAQRRVRPIRVAVLVLISLCVAMGLLSAIVRLPSLMQSEVPLIFLGVGIVLLIVPALPRWQCPECGHFFAHAEPEEKDEEDEDDDEEEKEDEEVG